MKLSLLGQKKNSARPGRLELYDTGLLDTFEVGTFKGLAAIHKCLFGDVYEFAGQMRTVNIAKGNFRFATGDVSASGTGKHRRYAAVFFR